MLYTNPVFGCYMK